MAQSGWAERLDLCVVIWTQVLGHTTQAFLLNKEKYIISYLASFTCSLQDEAEQVFSPGTGILRS